MSKSVTTIKKLEIPVKDQTGKLFFVSLDSLIAPPVSVPPTLASPTSVPDESKARFYVDTDDELEIANISVPETAVSTKKLETEAATLVQNFGITLNKNLHQRLVKITLSLLKDIRNPRKTREVLMRDDSLGGMGFSEEQARDIIKEIIDKKQDIFNKVKGDHLEASLKPKPVEQTVTDIYDAEKASSTVTKETLLTNVASRVRTESPVKDTTKVPTYTPKAASKPVGPVEELKLLTLTDFRYLGKGATESAQRVFQKIDLLGDESLELKAQAIKAWKGSPVYQDYLAIGHRSMEGHESVEAVITSKAVNDMTLDEFHAVADLNKSLQF